MEGGGRNRQITAHTGSCPSQKALLKKKNRRANMETLLKAPLLSLGCSPNGGGGGEENACMAGSLWRREEQVTAWEVRKATAPCPYPDGGQEQAWGLPAFLEGRLVGGG